MKAAQVAVGWALMLAASLVAWAAIVWVVVTVAQWAVGS